MTRHLCWAAAIACVGLVWGAGCGSGTKPVPRTPPSTVAMVANEAEPRDGWPGESPQGRESRTVQDPLWRGACGIPVTVSMEELMVPGGIERIQNRLVARALLSRPYRDGELDDATVGAILELQRRSELPAVGLPSYATVRALGIDPARVFASGSARCGGA